MSETITRRCPNCRKDIEHNVSECNEACEVGLGAHEHWHCKVCGRSVILPKGGEVLSGDPN